MIRQFASRTLLIGWVVFSCCAQTPEDRLTASELSDRGGELARVGQTDEALRYYRAALAKDPGDSVIRSDYATVLGWAEKYFEAIVEFQTVLQQDANPPEWLLQEYARAQLFGNQTAAALETLDRLIRNGDDSEATLARKGLALRWLSRPKEAEQAYRDALHAHPDSVSAQIGLIYSVADQNRLENALAMADDALRRNSGNWRLRVVKGQILNWLHSHWLLEIDSGTSTSSLERINPGRESYRRSVLAVGLLYRFE